MAPSEDESGGDKKEREEYEDLVKKVATEFLQEDSHLGPLMFIPGRVLHIEEGKEASSRYVSIIILLVLNQSLVN